MFYVCLRLILPKNFDVMENQLNYIRPFHDSEVNAAMNQILDNENFLMFLKRFIYEKEDIDAEVVLLRKIDTVLKFQDKISQKFVQKIIDRTVQNFKITHFESIDKNKGYLYVTNHRDIVLDSALLQLSLFNQGFKTAQSAIGNNLVLSDLLLNIAKLNKMFLVIRDGSVRELIENSNVLSSYISSSISQNNSVWIAQRNGRTKDGIDLTQQGLLKMLTLWGEGSILDKIYNLNIIPAAVSYEYESCDFLKARELVISENGKYEKRSGEDLLSIETGLTQFKGDVNIVFGEPLNDSYEEWKKLTGNDNEVLKYFATLLDASILKNYILYPSNFIAADLILNSSKFKTHYTDEQKEKFLAYCQKNIDKSDVDKERFKEKFLSIYANPVFQKEKLELL